MAPATANDKRLMIILPWARALPYRPMDTRVGRILGAPERDQNLAVRPVIRDFSDHRLAPPHGPIARAARVELDKDP